MVLARDTGPTSGERIGRAAILPRDNDLRAGVPEVAEGPSHRLIQVNVAPGCSPNDALDGKSVTVPLATRHLSAGGVKEATAWRVNRQAVAGC
jgi:hypothetical protein